MRTSVSNLRLPQSCACAFSYCVLGFLAALAALTPAQAAFHLWTIQEIYTDNTGALQFIELSTPETGQNYVNELSVKVSTPNKLQTHTFTVPGSPLPDDTLNRSLLFGTAGLQAAGGPTPDYIIPDNFLFPGGGNLTFFGAIFGAYTTLPTDGILSRTFTGGNAPNSPQNYAGQAGFVIATAPEPASSVLVGLGLLGAVLVRRRPRVCR
jgi:hypothetical protein